VKWSPLFEERRGLATSDSHPEQRRTVICCWPSPAQPFLVSGPVGTHGHILVRSKTTYVVLKWGILFDARRGLTTAAVILSRADQ
jgi:hypothetical protein